MQKTALRAAAGLHSATLLAGCADTKAAGSADPGVQNLVSEDDHVRVAEQRGRGVTLRLTVQPKASSAPAYEILPSSGGQDSSQSHDAAGQRVWRLLSF